MKITKNINGYIIEVNRDEYDDLIEATNLACEFNKTSWDDVEESKFREMSKELKAVKKRYLTDEEVAPLVNCFCCKNCLPPSERKRGKMCGLKECKFVKA